MRLRIIDNIPTNVNASTLTMIETELRLSLLRVAQVRHKCRNIITSTPRQRIMMMATTIPDTLCGIFVARPQYAPSSWRYTEDGSSKPTFKL